MHNQNYETLAAAFRAAVETEFYFLRRDFGFQSGDVQTRGLKYVSTAVSVVVYHDTNFGLQVEFALLSRQGKANMPPRKWGFMTVAKTSSPAAEADNGGQSFGLSEVLIAFREQDQLPADIRELVNFSLTNPGQYQRWFPAETVEQIGPAVHRLAEITREFAGALLRGDLDCFDLLSKQRTNLTELRQRKMWLNELPASLAAQCELIPTSELKRIRDEYLKEQILAKRGDEFDDIQGLPAEEFLKAYASRAVQRSK